MIACLENPPANFGAPVLEDAVTEAVRAWRDDGDQEAARQIVGHLAPLVRGIASQRLPRPWMVEDAVQNTLSNVFGALDTFDARVPLSAWTVFIAKNVCANILRSWKRCLVFASSEMGIENLQDVESGEHLPTLDNAIAAREDLRRIMRCIADMDEMDRFLVGLLCLGGGSAAEAADQTGLRPGAVRVRAYRIRAMLRASLQEA